MRLLRPIDAVQGAYVHGASGAEKTIRRSAAEKRI
jgi:hypothetical protein